MSQWTSRITAGERGNACGAISHSFLKLLLLVFVAAYDCGRW